MFAHQYNTIQYNTIQLKFYIALLTKLRSAHTPYEMAHCSCTAEQLRLKDMPKVPTRWLRLRFKPTILRSQGNELHHCATLPHPCPCIYYNVLLTAANEAQI